MKNMNTYDLVTEIIQFHKNSRILAREEEISELELTTLIKVNANPQINVDYCFSEKGDKVYFNTHYNCKIKDKIELEKQFESDRGPFKEIIINDTWIELIGECKKDKLNKDKLNEVIRYLLNSKLIKMIIPLM